MECTAKAYNQNNEREITRWKGKGTAMAIIKLGNSTNWQSERFEHQRHWRTCRQKQDAKNKEYKSTHQPATYATQHQHRRSQWAERLQSFAFCVLRLFIHTLRAPARQAKRLGGHRDNNIITTRLIRRARYGEHNMTRASTKALQVATARTTSLAEHYGKTPTELTHPKQPPNQTLRIGNSKTNQRNQQIRSDERNKTTFL